MILTGVTLLGCLLATPSRLVVALEHDNLLGGGASSYVQGLLGRLGAKEVRRLEGELDNTASAL